MAAARIRQGMQEKLYLGNLDAKRDWGFAGDYVEGMWLMMQQPSPTDYVLATGETHSVREFCELAFRRLGFNLEFSGKGAKEIGRDAESGREMILIDPRYFRPTEVDVLQGDASLARRELGWTPKVGFAELVAMMADADLAAVQAGVPFVFGEAPEIVALLDR
jgi:GDPmannose 4,6-dehydratase